MKKVTGYLILEWLNILKVELCHTQSHVKNDIKGQIPVIQFLDIFHSNLVH